MVDLQQRPSTSCFMQISIGSLDFYIILVLFFQPINFLNIFLIQLNLHLEQ